MYKQNTHIYLSKNLCFRVKICLMNSRVRVLKVILILPQNDFFREQDFHFPVVSAWVPEHSPDLVFSLLDPVQPTHDYSPTPAPDHTWKRGGVSEGGGPGRVDVAILRTLALQCTQRLPLAVPL